MSRRQVDASADEWQFQHLGHEVWTLHTRQDEVRAPRRVAQQHAASWRSDGAHMRSPGHSASAGVRSLTNAARVMRAARQWFSQSLCRYRHSGVSQSLRDRSSFSPHTLDRRLACPIDPWSGWILYVPSLGDSRVGLVGSATFGWLRSAIGQPGFAFACRAFQAEALVCEGWELNHHLSWQERMHTISPRGLCNLSEAVSSCFASVSLPTVVIAQKALFSVLGAGSLTLEASLASASTMTVGVVVDDTSRDSHCTPGPIAKSIPRCLLSPALATGRFQSAAPRALGSRRSRTAFFTSFGDASLPQDT